MVLQNQSTCPETSSYVLTNDMNQCHAWIWLFQNWDFFFSQSLGTNKLLQLKHHGIVLINAKYIKDVEHTIVNVHHEDLMVKVCLYPQTS